MQVIILEILCNKRIYMYICVYLPNPVIKTIAYSMFLFSFYLTVLSTFQNLTENKKIMFS